MVLRAWLVTTLILTFGLKAEGAFPLPPPRTPRVQVVDLDVGETGRVELWNGARAQIKLLALDEVRDPIRDAVRQAQVTVEVNGRVVDLTSANYHLPATVAGVQVDCTITRGYLTNTSQDHWGLTKAARLRLWPAGSPW